MIRVMVVDDQALVRAGFALMLSQHGDIEVCGEAADGVEAVRLAGELRPEIILMDLRMPRLDGAEATRAIVSVGAPTKVLVLTTFDLDEDIRGALAAGASGYLLKDIEPAELADAIRRCMAGDLPMSAAISRRLAQTFVGRVPRGTSRLDALTSREREVLSQLARGLSNAEIADALVVSPATIKTHVASILGKLGARDRIHAIIVAYEAGLA